MTLGELGSGASLDSLHRPPLIYLMGPTCSGKGTFLNQLRMRWMDRQLGFVEVGKMFRAKYPPSYFQGQMNPVHTRTEALTLYSLATRDCLKEEPEAILIDGQPRNGQVDLILESFPEHPKYFLYFTAPVEVRRQRAEARDQDEESKQLSFQRIQNDLIGYHDVLCRLLELDRIVHVIDTNKPVAEWIERAFDWLGEVI